MAKLIATRGLPGSGKTTWAEKYILEREAGTVVRVNRDSLRAMCHAGRWKGDKTERMIRQFRNQIVKDALFRRADVIVDDTNLSRHTLGELESIAADCHAEFEIRDFTDVPLDTCIERDLRRTNSVGEKVIRRMYREHLAPKVEAPEFDSDLPDAIIVDVDGTLAINDGHRGHYDFSEVGRDKPNQPIIDLVADRLWRWGELDILVFSGRDDSCSTATALWLARYGVPYHKLYLRKTGDKRKDAVVKREMYEEHVRGKYNVLYVIDDRNQVVEMWRSLGLTVLQVADGDF